MTFIFWFCLGLIAFSYLIYPGLIMVLAIIFPRSTKSDPGEYPEIAMVISAYNEETVLDKKIENCLAIDYPDDKINFVFGSDGSIDRTNEILASASHRIQSRIYPEREGKIRVLNKLIPDIKEELLLFSDANTLYQPESVKLLVRHFSDPIVGGVCGKLNLVKPSQTPGRTGEGLYWRYENLIKQAEGKINSVISANGAIFAIRRDLFESLPEDKIVNDDFSNTLSILRQNKRVIFEPCAIAEENTSPDMMSEFNRRIRIAALNFNALPELLPFLHPKYGFTALAIFSHKIVRWLVPFLGVGMLISNILLVGQRGIYIIFLTGQGLVYLAALLGFLGDKIFNKSGLFLPLYYLVLMNIAQVIGFWRSLTKTQKQAWERVSR